MCLIVSKEPGVAMPSQDKLEQWFNWNPHGVGISFPYRNAVRTIRGAMTIPEMWELIDKTEYVLKPKTLTESQLVIQFRLAVTGKPCPRFCHPFPISYKQEILDKLDVVSKHALAHNGVISEYYSLSKEVNDAQEFIKNYLVPLGENITHPIVGKLISQATDSKFVLLTHEKPHYWGTFFRDEPTNLMFSNQFYNQPKPSHPAYNYSMAWDVDDYNYNYIRPRNEPTLKTIYRCESCDNLTEDLYDISGGKLLVCPECFLGFYHRLPYPEEKFDT